LKTKTTAAFVPRRRASAARVIADFERLQADVAALVHECRGLPIHRVSLASPFMGQLKFNLYSALKLLTRHQHRHVSQAEQAAAAALVAAANVVEPSSPSAALLRLI